MGEILGAHVHSSKDSLSLLNSSQPSYLDSSGTVLLGLLEFANYSKSLSNWIPLWVIQVIKFDNYVRWVISKGWSSG